MGLYWKNIEIIPGMRLSVDLLHNEFVNDDGFAVAVEWEILSFGTRSQDEAYIDFAGGKKYPMEKVVKKKRLQARLERGELLQLPAGSEFMIVQEYHDGSAVFKRCYNLDMLQTVRSLKVLS